MRENVRQTVALILCLAVGAVVAPGAAVWGFVWGNDEGHYGAHQYDVRRYRYDRRRGVLRHAAPLRSRRKHSSGEDALAELGLPRYTNLLDSFPAIKDYRN